MKVMASSEAHLPQLQNHQAQRGVVRVICWSDPATSNAKANRKED